MTLDVGTVGHGTAALVPALDATLEALTLRGADDVDLGDVLEISDGDDVADLVLLAVLDADLTKVTDGSTPALAKRDQPWACSRVLGLDVAGKPSGRRWEPSVASVLTCDGAGGRLMTVTGTTLSSSSQTWVMPILRLRIMRRSFDLQLGGLGDIARAFLRVPLEDYSMTCASLLVISCCLASRARQPICAGRWPRQNPPSEHSLISIHARGRLHIVFAMFLQVRAVARPAEGRRLISLGQVLLATKRPVDASARAESTKFDAAPRRDPSRHPLAEPQFRDCP